MENPESIQVQSQEVALQKPIAIIGMSCRFPGAGSPQALWQVLANGIETITPVPPNRWNAEAFYDPDPNAKGKMISPMGGFLENEDLFDPFFFDISPREAPHVDPRQRLTLEVAWEALEDAGLPPHQLAGSRTGVFMAVLTDEYASLLYGDYDIIELYTGTGSANTTIPNRLSYFFNLHGPSIAMDTACSGALVAIHQACQSIQNGECTMALAGGVNVVLEPYTSIFLSKAMAISPDGHCKAFDKQANGLVRSEGVGVLVLKPLEQALADGNRVLAVIRGSAINHSGRSSGIMAPNGPAQERVMREAYRRAGLSPSRVQYIEAHGPGTPIGDPIEVNALGAILMPNRPKGRSCLLGSIKTNIGHAEAAAGIAGVIKTVLALQHRQIPPNLHFNEPNPNIPFSELPFIVPRSLSDWPQPDECLIAGVNGIGFTGVNAHIVLEEAPPAGRLETAANGQPRAYMLPLSAKSPEALRALAATYRDFLTGPEAPDLSGVSFTNSAGRTHFAHRLAVVGNSPQELSDQLAAFLAGETPKGLTSGIKPTGQPSPLVFVFSGQGSHWLKMGLTLMEQEPVFAAQLKECNRLTQAMIGWSLLDELAADESHSRLNKTEITQPAIFAMQVALNALWRSWGLKPDMIVGHSLGEAAAAYAAGALSLEEALSVVYHRSRLISRVEGKGKMAIVGLSLEEADLAIALAADEGLVSVAGSNSPTSSLLAGDPDTLERIVKSLERRGVFCRMVKGVSFAPHSPHMDPLKGELVEALRHLQPRPTDIPLISTVTGALIDGTELGADYWGRNLREPFLFTEAVRHLAQSGYTTFLEVSSHPVLVASIMQGLEALGKEGVALPSLRRDEPEQANLLATVGQLYTRGYGLDWRCIYPQGRLIGGLPTYPWQRERYWVDQLTDRPLGSVNQLGAAGGPKKAGRHPLLGEHARVAALPSQHTWEMDFGVDSVTYLKDHRVQAGIIMPGVAYLEMALGAADQALGSGNYLLERADFKQALYIPEGKKQRVQVVLTPEADGEATFQVLSAVEAGDSISTEWTEHASGTLRRLDGPTGTPEPLALPAIQARCPERPSGADHYQAMEKRGLSYGPTFRAIQHIWKRPGEALGRLELPAELTGSAAAYHIHPVLLDGGFQMPAIAPLTSMGEGETFLPVSVKSIQIHRPAGDKLWCHAVLTVPLEETDDQTCEWDLDLVDDQGLLSVAVKGLRLKQVTSRSAMDKWFYQVQWDAEPLSPIDQAQQRQAGTWLIFTGDAQEEPLATLLAERGESCILVHPGDAYRSEGAHVWINPQLPRDYERLLEQALPGHPACRAVVYRWAALTQTNEQLTVEGLETAQLLGPGGLLFLTQALLASRLAAKPRLWIITHGVQMVAPDDEPCLAQAALWGAARTIAVEQYEFRCSLVDVSMTPSEGEINALAAELWSDQVQDQIVLRGDRRYVARLGHGSGVPPEILSQPIVTGSRQAPFRLEIATPGVWTSLAARSVRRSRPGPGQVEIEVYAAGLSFRDIMLAAGLLPSPAEGVIPMGMECVGHVVSVGEGVETFKVGDEVMAFALHSLSRYATTAAALVAPKPASLSLEQAATLPVAFGLAYYAFNDLAHLKKGERVLIHTASDALGLAAIQLARLAGADVLTTGGTPESRAFLRDQIGLEHVFDSRDLGFADEVMKLTQGSGVDVVLNTLTGAGLTKSLSLLKPGGRFIELSQRDRFLNNPLRLGLLKQNQAFFAVDWSQLIQAQPDLLARLLADLRPLFENGQLVPIPYQAFSISDAAGVFMAQASGESIGKVLFMIRNEPLQIMPPAGQAVEIRADGTYLITGGVGGLGLVVARWLVDRGARSLVLMGRRGRDGMSPEAVQAVQELEAAGARVVVAKGDVVDKESLEIILNDVATSGSPLCGVIHAAGVVADTIITRMTYEQMNKVMPPKVQGSWNLHTLTVNTPLDFFIVFSSIASVIPTDGQLSYAGANAFLDMLSHYRRKHGLPAISINWGPWSDVGLLAMYPRLIDDLKEKGFLVFGPEYGLMALERLMADQPIQAAVVSIDWARFGQTWEGGYKPPILLDMYAAEVSQATVEAGRSSTFVDEVLLPAAAGERLALLESHLQKLAAGALRLDSSRLDKQLPLTALGIDSIMALELRNKIKDSLKVTVSVADLLRDLSVASMAKQIMGELQLEEQDAEIADLLAKVDQLSGQELAALLDG